MSKTWYGHHIETIKGEDYVLHKDYIELQNKLEKEIERINKALKWINENKYYFPSPNELINILKGDNK